MNLNLENLPEIDNIPELHEIDGYEATSPAHARTALYALDVALGDIQRIKADPNLSDYGRSQKIQPIAESVISAVGTFATLAQKDAAEADALDTALMGVGAPDNPMAASEDKELRDWWRALPVEERARIMDAMQTDEAAGQKFARLQLALLRSPIPVGADIEKQFMLDLWKQTARLDNPGAALRIDGLRNAAAWSERVLAITAGVAVQRLGLERGQVIEILASDTTGLALKGAAAFGFDKTDVARALRIAEAREAAKQAAKAA